MNFYLSSIQMSGIQMVNWIPDHTALRQLLTIQIPDQYGIKIPTVFTFSIVVRFQVTIAAKNWNDFVTVFSPLIEGLVFEMRSGSIVDSSYKPALMALADLCDIRDTSTNNRPMCKLLIEMVNIFTNNSSKHAFR